ncbi:hypothetical protein [Cohnella phaseoli]|uniref:hypothetical protein n=1 Tax=Cohnella phaseoli TaxID=456490 RepID=UPI0011C01DC9|nr:hypothetical protein [Cohnella phaseoli]
MVGRLQEYWPSLERPNRDCWAAASVLAKLRAFNRDVVWLQACWPSLELPNRDVVWLQGCWPSLERPTAMLGGCKSAGQA